MNHTEALRLRDEIAEKLSLLADYVSCAKQFNEISAIFDGQWRDGSEPLLAEIEKAVCEEYEIKPYALTCKARTARLAEARHVAMHLARKHTLESLSEIGAFWKRDHGTVLNSVKQVKNKLQTKERGFAERLARIEEKLKGETK